MRAAGFLLLVAGWGLAMAAVVLLHSPGPQAGFILASAAVEVLGLGLVFRSYLSSGAGPGN